MAVNVSEVAPDLAGTERRLRRNGGRGPGARRPVLAHVFLIALVLYFALPLWWLVVGSTKDIGGLFTGSAGPLWFDEEFHLVDNVKQLFTQNGGLYWRWLGNSFLYAFAGGIGATVFSILGTASPSTASAAATCSSPRCSAR